MYTHWLCYNSGLVPSAYWGVTSSYRSPIAGWPLGDLTYRSPIAGWPHPIICRPQPIAGWPQPMLYDLITCRPQPMLGDLCLLMGDLRLLLSDLLTCRPQPMLDDLCLIMGDLSLCWVTSAYWWVTSAYAGWPQPNAGWPHPMLRGSRRGVFRFPETDKQSKENLWGLTPPPPDPPLLTIMDHGRNINVPPTTVGQVESHVQVLYVCKWFYKCLNIIIYVDIILYHIIWD